MEIQIFNLATLLLVFSMFVLIKAWRKAKLPKNCENLPPSPPKLPIIGHLHLLRGSMPHRALAGVAQKYGSVLNLKLGKVSAVLISSREAAKEVLKEQDPACADRPGNTVTNIMWYDNHNIGFSPYNESWKQLRKICTTEQLSAKYVRSFGPIRVDEVARLIKSLESSCGSPVNIREEVHALIMSVVSRAAFGEVLKEPEEMTGLMKDSFDLAGQFELAGLLPSFLFTNSLNRNMNKLWGMRTRLDKILDAIIQEHKSKGGGEAGRQDVVDVLLRLKNSGDLEVPITDENIKGVIYDIFTGGIETSASTIEWAMAEMMRSPRVMNKLQAEIRRAAKGKKTLEESDVQGLKFLKLVIKETLRLHPPIAVLPRASRDNCTVKGYSIPLKSKVFFHTWSMGRNPEYWDQPETFQPERFEDNSTDFLGNNMEFIPFGAGKRMCPGMNFALATIEFCLAQLLYHFDWKLPKGMKAEDVDMTEKDGLAVSKKDDLYLVATAYNTFN